MLDRMFYKNHINEVVEFGVGGIIINTNDFRDYEWTYNNKYKKITKFERGISKKTLPVTITGEDAKEKANHMFEVFEKDVASGSHGEIVINDYSLKGYFYASKKIEYTTEGIIKLELSFVSDSSTWIKESEPYHFNVEESESKGLDYNHDFAYDFTSTLYTAQLANPNYTDTAFKLIVCGQAINPVVTIGGHEYEIDTIVEENELLIVDSISKTVILKKEDGTEVNKFADRNKDSYIFEPIKSGANSVSWGSDFSFDVVLVEQRSEPKWN